MACNTAHVLIDDIATILGKKPVSLIKVTKQHVKEGNYSRLGILGTPTTLKCGLYDSKDATLVSLSNSQQAQTEKLIREVIANDLADGVVKLQSQIDLLLSKGVEAVILGCTELSVVASELEPRPLIDPLSIVVPYLFKDIMEEI